MNWNTARAMLAGGAIVGGALLLTGCPATKGDAPEPTGGNVKPGTNTRVIQMPNGFRNIAATCDGTTGVYVTSRGWSEAGGGSGDSLPSGIAVLANDPRCAK
jgi:hypothetical protein